MFTNANKKQTQNHYKKQLINLAQLSNYQPIPSIMKQSDHFNYTIIKSNNRIAKKQKNRINIIDYDKYQNEQVQKQNSYENQRNYQQNNESSNIKNKIKINGKYHSGSLHHQSQNYSQPLNFNKISYLQYDQNKNLMMANKSLSRLIVSPASLKNNKKNLLRNYYSANKNENPQQQQIELKKQKHLKKKYLTINTRLDTQQNNESNTNNNQQYEQNQITSKENKNSKIRPIIDLSINAQRIKGRMSQQDKFRKHQKYYSLLSRQQERNITSGKSYNTVNTNLMEQFKSQNKNINDNFQPLYSQNTININPYETNHKVIAAKKLFQNTITTPLQQQNYSDDSQYQKDANPGPGHYQVNYSSFQTKTSHLKSTKATQNAFGGGKCPRFRYSQKQQEKIKDKSQLSHKNNLTKLKRFNQRQKSHIFLQKKLKEKQKELPFGSNLPRQAQNQGINKMIKKDLLSFPSPVDYSPRIGMQEELIRKIQRNFKGSFGVSEKRFDTLRKWDQLGPGKYNISDSLDILNFNFNNNESLNQNIGGSYFFISKKNRFQ